VSGFGLVVPGEATVHHDPTETSLHYPPSRNHGKPFDLGVPGDDVDIDTEGGAVLDGLGLVAGVDPCLGDRGVVGGDPGEELFAGLVVGDTGCGHDDQQ
jgi:hypothetical protein